MKKHGYGGTMKLEPGEGARGGDVVFQTGAGWRPLGADASALDGSFIFKRPDGGEFFRIGPEGFFVKGDKVADDRKLYEAFSEWFATCVWERREVDSGG